MPKSQHSGVAAPWRNRRPTDTRFLEYSSRCRDLHFSRRPAHRREVIAGAEIHPSVYAAGSVYPDMFGAGMTADALWLNGSGSRCFFHAILYFPTPGNRVSRVPRFMVVMVPVIGASATHDSIIQRGHHACFRGISEDPKRPLHDLEGPLRPGISLAGSAAVRQFLRP